MANYPKSIPVIVLNQADRDRLQCIIEAFNLPPSKRMMAAFEAAFKAGFADASPSPNSRG